MRRECGMTNREGRQFALTDAKRAYTQTLLGLFGPSGSGKTRSALALAKGIVNVAGGKIAVVDTESGRALHYAADYRFRHLDMGPPFGSLDYLDAISAAVDDGATVIVVDSASHEHEGEGGVLESHDEAVERKSGGNEAKAARIAMAEWAKPKAAHNRLVNRIQQLRCHIIFCFRAKPKLDHRGTPLGWHAVGGSRLVYEMFARVLLLADDPGMPVYSSDDPGHQSAIKAAFLTRAKGTAFRPGQRLSEAHGEWLARWSAGDAPVHQATGDAHPLVVAYQSAMTAEAFREADAARAASWPTVSEADKGAIKAAYAAAKARLS